MTQNQLELTAQEVLTTTRSVRKRLDLTRPVDYSLILECLDIAHQAPTGSNKQTWHWMLIDSADLKSAIAEYYAKSFDSYIVSSERNTVAEGTPRAARFEAVTSSSTYLRAHLHEVPLMVIPCQLGRPPAEGDHFAAASYWGSVLPAVWSFMLALRTRGMGCTWTTLHLNFEREVADLLGIPFDDCAQVALLPVAQTVGSEFRQAVRAPAAEAVHWNRW